MHVLGLTDYLGNVGGAEISARTILNGLGSHEKVDEVTVIGVDIPGIDRLNFSDATVVPVEPPSFVSELPEFASDLVIERLLARTARGYVDKADIVHAHHRRSSLALARIETSCPSVTTVRDYWPTCPISIYHVEGEACTGCDDCLDDCVTYQGWDGVTEPAIKAYLLAKRRHQRYALRSQDSAVFIAEHLRNRLEGDVLFPPQTEVIYNPVSLDTNVEPTNFKVPTFLTASSLTDSKGIETAIRAMGKIIDDYPQCQLIIKGDGPQRDYLAELATDVAPNAVEFHGRVPPAEVYRDMAGATATIFPSLWDEPFGRITVESMMLGTPVVGSDVGGISEIIDNGETGLLFPAGDDDALADQLEKLITREKFRSEIVEAARRLVEEFRPDTIVQEHINLYKSLLNSDI